MADEVARRRAAQEAARKAREKADKAAAKKKAADAKAVYKAWVRGQKERVAREKAQAKLRAMNKKKK